MELKAMVFLDRTRDRAMISRLYARWTIDELASGAGVSRTLIGMWLNSRRGLHLRSVRSLEEFAGEAILPPLEQMPMADPDEVRSRRVAATRKVRAA